MYQEEILIKNNTTGTKRRITKASWKLLAHHERAKWTVLGDAVPKNPVAEGQESFQPQKLRVSTPPLEVINKGAVEKNPAYTKEADTDDAGANKQVTEIVPDGAKSAEPAATEQVKQPAQEEKKAEQQPAQTQTTESVKTDTAKTVTEKPATAKGKNPNQTS